VGEVGDSEVAEVKSAGLRRNRLYERKFDWAEARRRRAAGETLAAIARSLGVNKEAVRRVVLLPEWMVTRPLEQVELSRASATPRRWDQDECPRCTALKRRTSTLCHRCFNETRLGQMSVERTPGQSKARLGNVTLGRVVKYDGRWGVVERAYRGRAIHFWDGPAEVIPYDAEVEVAPSLKVFVDGVEQQPEPVL
jgi:hypothetical protein